MKACIVFLTTLLFAIACVAQNAMLSGRVTDAGDKNPIAEVSILVANSTLGTKTDAGGNYSLKLSPGSYELIISIIGYQTKTVNIAIGETPQQLDIALAIRSIQLNEVQISADSWKHDLERFKTQFIGTTNAADCALINPKVLELNFDIEKNRLTASNNDLLVVQNNVLGYRLGFLIKEFSADFISGKCHYRASVVFEQMHGSKSDEKRWVKNRENAYKGSFTHFLTALSKKQLSKEKFVVYEMTRIVNPHWKEDSARVAKSKQIAASRSNVRLMYMRGADKNIETLSRKKLSDDDLMSPTDKADAFKLQFPGYIYVIYKGKTVDADMDDLKRQPEAYYYQISALSLKDTKQPAYFNNKGQLLTHEAVFFEGAWDSRIVDMLPSDYKLF